MGVLCNSVVFLTLLSCVFVGSSCSTIAGLEHKSRDIYYDVITRKKIPIVQRLGDQQEEPNTSRYGRIPCSCEGSMCGCCAWFNVRWFNFNRKGCFNLTYDPMEFAIKGNMFMDDESLYEYQISAKNPPPACLQVPVPYIPVTDLCVQLFDVYTAGLNMHMCINFVTRIEHAELLVLEFDCVQFGRDGVGLQKFNQTASSNASTSTSTSPSTRVMYDSTVPDFDLNVLEINDTIAKIWRKR
ncbi:uncharacterized protein LOC126841069 [Adelges cooleyi]|uniref:uncharacterized protein LOC126841069 n=1 Tax=Adelges cooleyi TaxID=133065 RepID=UPI00217F40A7|nr:uncharacterized protein LOC126841069 [Adelges cooleyi]